MAKTWKQPKCPLIDDLVHLYNGILLSSIFMRKDEILPFVTIWMDVESIILSEISQTEKVKNHIILLMYGI